jgi:hypothetical protein
VSNFRPRFTESVSTGLVRRAEPSAHVPPPATTFLKPRWLGLHLFVWAITAAMVLHPPSAAGDAAQLAVRPGQPCNDYLWELNLADVARRGRLVKPKEADAHPIAPRSLEPETINGDVSKDR